MTQLIDTFNKYLVIKDGEILHKNGIRDPDFVPSQQLQFKVPCGELIIGQCSSGTNDQDYIDYFTHYIEQMEGTHILIMAHCCWNYSPGVREALRRRFPDKVLMFPRHRDYACHWDYRRIASDLVSAGIMHICDIPFPSPSGS